MWTTTRTLILVAILSLMLICCVAVAGIFLWARQEGLNPVKAVQLRLSLALNDDELNTPADARDQRYYRFEIVPGDSASAIAQNLQLAGLIRDPDLFLDYVQYHQLDAQLEAGTYYLQKSQTMPDIAYALTDASVATITFGTLPGLRIEEVATSVASEQRLGILEGEFLSVVGRGATISPDFKAWAGFPDLLYEGGPSPSLEGFLYPTIYKLKPGLTVYELRDEMLAAFRQEVEPLYTLYLGQTPPEEALTIYQVVTLASIVQREMLDAEEAPKIAAVYLNRLEQNMKLDADPTVQYAIGYRDQRWWPRLIVQNDDFPESQNDYAAKNSIQPDYQYNTYLSQPGDSIDDLLPPGPIASPGLAAIQAVLNPAPIKDLYFRACPGEDRHRFSLDFDAHQVVCETPAP